MSQFTINKRLLSDILAKYRTTFDAFCELVNNALQAGAKEIRITLTKPSGFFSEHAFERITIRDAGVGVSKSEFNWKVLEIATDAKKDGKGIGRFAALQLGATMRIETVAFDQFDKSFYRSSLIIDTMTWSDAKSLDSIPLDDQHEKLEGKPQAYYQVEITNFYAEAVTKVERHHQMHRDFAPERIEAALFARYADIVFRQSTKFLIDGKPIDPNAHIIGEVEKKDESFVAHDGTSYTFKYQFMEVQAPGEKHRVFLRVKNGDIQTVAHSFDYTAEIPAGHRWFVFVDSDYFDANADLFRGLFQPEIDPTTEHVHKSIKEHLDTFFLKKYEQYTDFVKQLKSDTAYPYRDREPSSGIRGAVFNQLAFHVEEQHHLLGRRQEIRKLVYRLIDRALNQRDFEELLTEVVKIDEKLASRFRALLKEVDLEDVIAFSDEVRRKGQHLDFLHKLVYGLFAEHVNERSQLHKIVQRHLWIFGEQYNDTPILFSDKNLENNLKRLRDELFDYEPSEDDENLVKVEDEKLRAITDLFFFNERILDEEHSEIIVVELKAPRVKLGEKELRQAKQYSRQIQKQAVFPEKLSYKVILLGSDVTDAVAREYGQRDPKNPWLVDKPTTGKPVEVWVMKWADLLATNRRKLNYLGKQLDAKDREVREIWEREFSDIPLHKLASLLKADGSG